MTQPNDPRAGDKRRALEMALTTIEKQFGKGAIMRLGEAARFTVDAIPTGSIALDMALGVGGVPRGRIVEIFGTESSGKTTLALSIVAQSQRQGGTCAFIDAEHALDPEYASNIGVNIADLLVAQPGTGEEALEIMDSLIRSNALDVVVLDSVAALVPKAEIDGEMGDSHVGLQARLMSQALRKIAGNLSRANCCAIFINQIREKIGVMFGNPETTPGGRALKFWASVRLDVRRIETVKSGTEAVGARTRVKVVKNKVAPPFRVAEFDILFGKGISRAGGVLDLAVELDIVQRSGSHFSYGETRLGQGRENARAYLESHAELLDEIEQRIRASSKFPTSAAAAADQFAEG